MTPQAASTHPGTHCKPVAMQPKTTARRSFWEMDFGAALRARVVSASGAIRHWSIGAMRGRQRPGRALCFPTPRKSSALRVLAFSESCQLPPLDSRLGEPGMDIVLKIDFARAGPRATAPAGDHPEDRKSTRLNSSHLGISYA